MLNDVGIPPLDESEDDSDDFAAEHGVKRSRVRKAAIPPAKGRLIANVTLFSEDTTLPGGGGNFLSLSVFLLILVAILVIGGLLLFNR